MFKSKKQKKDEKAAKAAKKAVAVATAKKAKVNVVKRPEPVAAPVSVAPVVPPKATPKPVAKPAEPPVKIHMLGNAMIDGVQYSAGQELTVSMRLYKQIGTSCVSMAKWRNMQSKGGLSSLRK